MDELAAHLARERGEAASEPSSRDHAARTRYHVHVPRLVDAGVTEYDPQSRVIRYRSDERLERWHERVRSDERD